MQTVLGAGGPIAEELTRELRDRFGAELRLVSRHPSSLVGGEQLVSADLLDPEAADRAVAGSDTVYLTAGLPMDSALWEAQFPGLMRNVLDACCRHDAKLVYFDNTYMYAGTAEPQTEDTSFAPNGRKGRVRGAVARTLLDAMAAGRVEALIARAPEFYGPGRTKSLTNTLVFDRLRAGRRALVPLSATTERSLIWTPDAGRATAWLGNASDTFGRTWHLPIDQDRRTYAELVAVAAEITGRRARYTVIPKLIFDVGAPFAPQLREVAELLPRYAVDNRFVCDAFNARFPEFVVTTYRDGIATLLASGSPAGHE